MFGAILGDIIGSKWEGALFRREPITLLTPYNKFTDDTVLTCAVADAFLHGRTIEDALRDWWHRYPGRHYGGWFSYWARTPQAPASTSTSNGAAMRISPVALLCPDLATTLALAERYSRPTHNSEEGLRGAMAVATAIRTALDTRDPLAVRDIVRRRFYPLDRTMRDYVAHQCFELRCDDTVPKAITAALEADCYEDVMRNAVLIGGDTDTIAAMAEALYGLPASLATWGWQKLPGEMQDLIHEEYAAAGVPLIFHGKERRLVESPTPAPGLTGRLRVAWDHLVGGR